MKKLNLLFLIVFAISLMACSSKTGKVKNINENDITYFKDSRTGLCFAIIGAKEGKDFVNQSTSIGFTCVPCEKVEHLLMKK